MNFRRLWEIKVITLCILAVAVLTKHADAGGLNITKAQYIATYNQLLSKFKLRLKYDANFSSEQNMDVYQLPGDKAMVGCIPGGSEKIDAILLVISTTGKEEEFAGIMVSGVVAAQPNPTAQTIDLLIKKFKNALKNSPTGFSFEVGYQKITYKKISSSAIRVSIEPL